jgi:medium-chain acyl-[acyl-carrier-protein] hydrolase
MRSSWLSTPRPVARPRARLVCIPYAGGSAAAYHGWLPLLPADVELVVAQLPGRGLRAREAPVTSLAVLVDALEQALTALPPLPFVLFGHSMGAGVAFELTRALRRRRRPEPAHLFVSAAAAPQLPRADRPRHDLPEPELLTELQRFGGTPDVLLRDPELLALVLPALRADFAVLETHRYRSERPLELPITALAGTADACVAPASVEAWRVQTTGRFDLQRIDDGHFFVHTKRERVVQSVTAALAPLRASAIPKQAEGAPTVA